MLAKRIIPCLDVRNGRVVKGTNFEGLRDMADPVELAHFYNTSGADELVFYDITASVEGRGLFTGILRRVASEIFIPLTVGGGIRTLDDFDRVLKCGADKVSVNSGAIADPRHHRRGGKEIRRPVRGAQHGRQAGGRAVPPLRQGRPGGHRHRRHGVGRPGRGIDGAGEIVLNSIDTDGVKQGFDLEMLDALAARVSVPIIASGGAGKHGGLCGAVHPPRHRRRAGGLHLPHPAGGHPGAEAVSAGQGRGDAAVSRIRRIMREEGIHHGTEI